MSGSAQRLRAGVGGRVAGHWSALLRCFRGAHRWLTSRLAGVSLLGRVVILAGVGSWLAGWWFGWRELMVIAGGCFLISVLCALFIVRRSPVSIEIRMDPPRVVAGDSSFGQVTVKSASSRRTLPTRVELAVGDSLAEFNVDSLEPGFAAEELFVVPTDRRGVIGIGPATAVRGDPLGLFSRQMASSPRCELIVHPVTVALEPFGSGLLRDLEGLTTAQLSPSDLAFHALREYVPGDDRRHIHWRSTARTGRLQVRQFQDTRRSTLCAVVDAQPDAYADEEEFEVAMQIAGSVARRACADGLAAVVAAGDQAGSGVVPHALLDPLARARLSAAVPDLASLVERAVSRGADISVAVLVSGSRASDAGVQRAASRFPIDVSVLGLKVVPDEPMRLRGRGRAVIAQLPELRDLPSLVGSELP